MKKIKRILCLFLSFTIFCFQSMVVVSAEEFRLDEDSVLIDGFNPPENATIIHYLNSSAKPYTKIANRVDELWVGDHHRFTVALNRRVNAEISWFSSNPEVASIDKRTGELTALSAGTTVITMKDSVNNIK